MYNKNVRILGIDPGTGIVGFGIIDVDSGNTKFVEAGVIRTPAHQEDSERLLTIYQDLKGIISQYKPDVMAVEKLFFIRNITTAMSVSQARGVILLLGKQKKIQLNEYTPLQIKQAVVGYGRATKEQVIYMVEKLLNLPKKPHPDDVADALAVAICTTHCCNNLLWRNKL